MSWCNRGFGSCMGRVEGEELLEELGLGDCAVWVVCEAESEKAGGIAVKGDFVMSADTGDYLVDVRLSVTEDEGVVNIYDYVRCLGRGASIEEAVVKLGHDITFREECCLVMEVEYSAGVG